MYGQKYSNVLYVEKIHEDSAYGSWFMNANGIFVHSCAFHSHSRPFSIGLIALQIQC